MAETQPPPPASTTTPTPTPIPNPLNAASAEFTPASGTAWADEVASPTTETGAAKDMPQLDGAPEVFGGSGLQDSEYEVQVTLSEMQADASNPLHSVQSFEQLGLNEHILKGLYSMNYKKPSKIQEKALPILLGNPPRNMIAQSQSGTGKTAAFVITILSRLDFSRPESPQALVLAPARELARQIEGVIHTVGQFIPNLTIQPAVPGAVERNAPVRSMVVVGTPGTVIDLIKRRQLDTRFLQLLCLDEADNMLDQDGLGEQCMRVKSTLPSLKQILLFSATFPEGVTQYAHRFCPNAAEIKLKHNELTVGGIRQMFMDCSNGDQGKYDVLVQLYDLMTIGSSIIFTKTRETATGIARALNDAGHKVVAIHGAFEGAERDAILEGFRNGSAKVLITTNVLARGIDVQSVSMVINYDIPMKGARDAEPDFESYLHRIGRTGRFGRVGVSISFVFDKKSFMALVAIANHYNIEMVKLDQDDPEATEKLITEVIKSSRAGVNFQQT